MPKEEWGQKRVCPTTGKRFYDLKRDPIVSPYTGEAVDVGLAHNKVSVSAAAKDTNSKTEEEGLVIDDLDAEDNEAMSEIDDGLLEDDVDENVSLDDLTDVPNEEDES